jgi:outer membrane protein assembly factor BamB
VAGSVVYASTYASQKVYAFDAHTGTVLWSATPRGCCGSGLSGPVSVANDLAYVTTGNHVVAYNANMGSLVFTSSASPGRYLGTTAAVSNGVAFVQAWGGFLDAFNASTGALLWSSPTMSDGVSGPAVDGSTVVVSTQRNLIAFAASDGHRSWTVDGGADQQPAIANGVVYADTPHGMQVLSEASGAVLRPGGFACGYPIVSHGAVWAVCSSAGMAELGL